MKKEERTGIIYMITNSINIKPYVGQTTNLKKRMEAHKAANNKSSVLHKSIRRYGWDKFQVIILHENVPLKDLDWLEKECIWIWNCMVPNGYNLQAGGSGGLPSEETKKKQSDAKKGMYDGKDNPMYGKKHSEESKKKTSETLKGKYTKEKHKSYRKDIWDQKDDIIEKYQNGLSSPQIANEYKCDPSLIRKILSDNNIQIRSQKRSDVRNHSNMIIKEYLNENTLNDLSQKYDCSPQVIKRILLENNIEIRTERLEQTNRKISESQKGKVLSKDHRKKLSIANTGKKHTDESKEKMSRAQKGKPKSEDHKRKLSEAGKGKPHSEERIWNMKLAKSKAKRKKEEENGQMFLF